MRREPEPGPNQEDGEGSISEVRACQALNRFGEPCRAPALTGSSRCFWHSEEAAQARQQARKKGGQNTAQVRVGQGPDEPLRICSISDIMSLLETAASDIMRLPSSERRARSLVYVALGALKALEVGAIEERLSALETRLNDSTPDPRQPWRKTAWPTSSVD